jgi:hypothetical protein
MFAGLDYRFGETLILIQLFLSCQHKYTIQQKIVSFVSIAIANWSSQIF